jgi:hypothetical protein
MPTSPPSNPNPKSYESPQPPENDVTRGGFEPAQDRPFAPPPSQARREIPATDMAGLATGNSGQKASGRIDDDSAPITNGPGRISG